MDLYHLSREKPAGSRFRRVLSRGVRLDQWSVSSSGSCLTGTGMDSGLLRPHTLRLSVKRKQRQWLGWLVMTVHVVVLERCTDLGFLFLSARPWLTRRSAALTILPVLLEKCNATATGGCSLASWSVREDAESRWGKHRAWAVKGEWRGHCLTWMVITAGAPLRQSEIKSQAVAVQLDWPPAGLKKKIFAFNKDYSHIYACLYKNKGCTKSQNHTATNMHTDAKINY